MQIEKSVQSVLNKISQWSHQNFFRTTRVDRPNLWIPFVSPVKLLLFHFGSIVEHFWFRHFLECERTASISFRCDWRKWRRSGRLISTLRKCVIRSIEFQRDFVVCLFFFFCILGWTAETNEKTEKKLADISIDWLPFALIHFDFSFRFVFFSCSSNSAKCDFF